MTTAMPEYAEIVGADFVDTLGRWEMFDENDDKTIQCRIVICPEEEGGFSAYASRLAGVAGQGETIEECLADVKESFCAVISTYREIGQEIPAALYTAVAEVLAYVYQLRRFETTGGDVPAPPRNIVVPGNLDPEQALANE